jgi:phosphoribosylanthranilate isomerase
MKIKVCGMRDTSNINELAGLKPDFIGFILYPGSARYVGDKYQLDAVIPDQTKKVGVFVNALIKDVFNWKIRLNLDLVQLHGAEPPEYCSEIHHLGLTIIKAFGISTDFDFNLLDEYTPYCDYFLFDTKTALHGGSGQKFDWEILDSYPLQTPYFLSGGIGPQDAEILSTKESEKLFAIDINSGFEITPGIKDIDQVRQFIKKIRIN